MDSDFDFDYLCVSSRLRLSRREKSKLSPQLKRIVNWIAKLEKGVPLEKGLSFHQSLSFLDTLRKDKTGSSFSKNKALANSPECNKDYFSVPKVIKSK